jgi:hypothetical protein
VDRKITGFGFQISVQSSQSYRLDVDKSGQADMNDLLVIMSHFGTKLGGSNYSSDCDINLDKRIDMENVNVELTHFGQKIR